MWRRTPRHRRASAPPPRPGIRIRISTRDGVVVDADSEHLYYSAKFGGAPGCDPGCLPGCDKHGWLNLVGGGPVGQQMGMPCPAGEFSAVPIKIEIKPI